MLEEIENQNQPEKFKKKPVNFINENNENTPHPTPKKGRRILIISITILLLISVIFVSRAFSAPVSTDNPYEYDPITLEPKKPESIIKVLFFLRTINLKNIALINAGNAIFNVLTPSTVIPPY